MAAPTPEEVERRRELVDRVQATAAALVEAINRISADAPGALIDEDPATVASLAEDTSDIGARLEAFRDATMAAGNYVRTGRKRPPPPPPRKQQRRRR